MCGRYDFTPGEFREIRIRWNLDSRWRPKCGSFANGALCPRGLKIRLWETR